MPKAKSDGRLLMDHIIKTVTKSDWSPIEWDSAVRQIAIGSVDSEDARELSHSLLDWYCPIRELDLSEEDQALLDQDANDPDLDKSERKKLLRRQRKAAKRARAKSGNFTSKVDADFIELVGGVLRSCSSSQAADKLAFVSVLSEQLDINQLTDLLRRVRPYKSSFRPPRTPMAFRDELQVAEDLPVTDRVGVYEYVYVAAHSPLYGLSYSLKERKKLEVAKPDDDWDGDWKATMFESFGHDKFLYFEGQQIPMSDLLEIPELRWKMKHQPLMMMAALDVPYSFKPEAKYSLPVEYLNNMNEVLQKKQVSTRWNDINTFIEESKKLNLEFDIPITLYFEDRNVSGCKITTITSSTQLNANRNYMGNCTGGLKNRLENGNSVLFIVEDDNGMRHNVHFNREGQLLESKARHNAAPSPQVKRIHSELGEIVQQAFGEVR